MHYLNDYQENPGPAVWRHYHEGGGTWIDPEETRAIAIETMERVRRKAGVLAERLTGLGWTSLCGEMVGQPATRPFPGEDRARDLGVHHFPLALTAFWEVVGHIDFIWDYGRQDTPPDLFGDTSLLDLDPLAIGPAETLGYRTQKWADWIDMGDHATGSPFLLDLAPDQYHKANVSGGSAYHVLVPDDAVDPMFRGDHFSMRFTTYLRHAFKWGGFPGLASLPFSGPILDRVKALTEGLEPF